MVIVRYHRSVSSTHRRHTLINLSNVGAWNKSVINVSSWKGVVCLNVRIRNADSLSRFTEIKGIMFPDGSILHN